MRQGRHPGGNGRPRFCPVHRGLGGLRVAGLSAQAQGTFFLSRSAARVSACLIVRDEEQRLPRCLSSIRPYCDEIVVVDTGSTDATLAVARACGAQVYCHEWNGDFAAARNAALDLATGDWVLVIDADETLSVPEGSPVRDPGRFRQWLACVPFDAFMVPIHNLTDSGETYIIHYERLFRRHPAIRFEGRIHEQVAPSLARLGARLALAPFEIHHDGYLSQVRRDRNKGQRNVALLVRALQDGPQNWYLHLKLGEEYLAQGRVPEALAQAQAALELCPPSHPLLERCVVVAAEALASAGRFDEALALFERHRAQARLTAHFYYAWGLVHRLAGNRRAALEALFKAVAFGDPGPRSPLCIPGVGSYLAWTAIGHLWRECGQATKAVAAYRQALQIRPNHPEAVRALAELLAAHGVPDDATFAELRRADLSHPPTAAAAIQGLLAGGRVELATRLLALPGCEPSGAGAAPARGKRLTHPLPRDSLKWFWLGVAHANAGRFQEAVQCFEQVGPDDPLSAAACHERAFCHMMRGELEQAERAAREAVLHPDEAPNAEVLLQLLALKRGSDVAPLAAGAAGQAALVRLLYRFVRLGHAEGVHLCQRVAQGMGMAPCRVADLVGRILRECGRNDQGVACLVQAASSRPEPP